MAETTAAGVNEGGFTPRILMPLPDQGFDPTEAALPWQACTSHGWRVTLSTEHGTVAQADFHKLKGPLPGLLSAGAQAQAAYRQMAQDPDFRRPIPYAGIDARLYDAILLPGGDTPGMHQYLENTELQEKVLQFWQQGKLIGAICHGVLVLARTVDPETGRSILYGRQVTAVPGSLDRAAYLLDRWLIRHGYLMYSRCVADEVRACLARPGDFFRGPGILRPYVVCDGNLITARWYIDAALLGERFVGELLRRMASYAPAGIAAGTR